MKKLGQVSFEAKVIDGINDEEILLLVLHANLSSRGFNEIEKGIVLKKFLDIGYSYDRLMAEIAPYRQKKYSRISSVKTKKYSIFVIIKDHNQFFF
ncbi:MAG: hypothetical protein ACYST3_04790 [Planctomycetota bacterium]